MRRINDLNVVVIVDGLDLSAMGGVGTFVYDFVAELLTRSNTNVYLIGVVKSSLMKDSLRQDLKEKGASIICLSAHSRKDAIINHFKYTRKLHKLLSEISKKEKTICNLHLKLGVMIGAIASIGLKNVMCVETYHNSYKNYHVQCWMLRPVIKHYICVSSEAGREMHRRFFIPWRRITSIPNGVSRLALRSEFERSDKKNDINNVLSVGRLSYEKNIITSVKAFLKLPKKDIIYTIIGDGPQREELENLINDKSDINYVGALDRKEVLEYINSTDIVLMPSLWEGRSIFMLEAAAFDKPFILSDCPGLREPFNEKPLEENELFRVCDFGYLVKTKSEEGYISSIVHFFEHPELHSEMSNCVKKMSIENDMKKVVDKYLKVFKSI